MSSTSRNCCGEAFRVARKNVLMTVPNSEDIEQMKANDVTYAHMLSSDHVHFFDPESLEELLKRYSGEIFRSSASIRFIRSGFSAVRAFLRPQTAFPPRPVEAAVFQPSLCCCERSRKLISICESLAAGRRLP